MVVEKESAALYITLQGNIKSKPSFLYPNLHDMKLRKGDVFHSCKKIICNLQKFLKLVRSPVERKRFAGI